MDKRKIRGEPVWLSQIIVTQNNHLIKMVLLGVPDAVRSVNAQFVQGKSVYAPCIGEILRINEAYRIRVMKLQGSPYCIGTVVCESLISNIVTEDDIPLVLPKKIRELGIPFQPEWLDITRDVLSKWMPALRTLDDGRKLFQINLPNVEAVFEALLPHTQSLQNQVDSRDVIYNAVATDIPAEGIVFRLAKKLKGFVIGAKADFETKVKDLFSPSFIPGESLQDTVSKCLSQFRKKPYPAQLVTISALLKGLSSRKRVFGLIAEMGCGKTLMATYIAILYHLCIFRAPTRTLILCPGHLISTWAQEIADICGASVTIVTANGTDCLAKLVQLRTHPRNPRTPEFWIIGFNRMKTGAHWETKIRHHPVKGPRCPSCGISLNTFHEEVEFVHDGDWLTSKQRVFCFSCKSPLWGPRQDDRKYAPVLYIKKYLSGHFHLLITDEVQKLKGGNTIQGTILGQLASLIPKTLILTGTLSGGKASDVFYLIQRAFALNLSKHERGTMLPPFNAIQAFVAQYGSLEKTYKAAAEDRRSGRSYRETVSVRELPGISPMLLRQFFLDFCAFLRISDISDALPPYEEVLEFQELPDEVQEAYKELEEALTKKARDAMFAGDMTVLGQMVSVLLAWPDMPHLNIDITNKKGEVILTTPSFPDILTPKDHRLIQLVQEANSAGRRCLIFVEYTGMGALSHVHDRLTSAGCRVLVMKPSIPTEKRLDWIRSKMATGKFDNLLCHPKLVETGLNLIEFPEVIFWQTGYSTYILRQASRRSWRPGQQHKVSVRFMINRNTFQESAMALIASKLESALILEGELSDKGLVSLSNSGSGLGDLARELLGTTKKTSLEAVFASYRSLEESALQQARESIGTRSELPDVSPTHGSMFQQKPPVKPEPLIPKARPVRVGELISMNGQEIYRGKIKGSEVIVGLETLQVGKRSFSRQDHFFFAQGRGKLLDYVLIQEPALLGVQLGVYLAA